MKVQNGLLRFVSPVVRAVLVVGAAAACTSAATEVAPVGTYRLASFRGNSLPTPAESTSPSEITGGTLRLEAHRYEFSIRYRSRADSNDTNSFVSRGRREAIANGEFSLIHEEGMASVDRSFLLRFDARHRPIVQGNLASSYEFEPVR